MENGAEQNVDNTPQGNGATSPEGLEELKAQLEEEKQAKAALESSLAERTARVAELEAAESEARSESEAKGAELEAKSAELTALGQARDQAVAKCLELARALNPEVPDHLIAGAGVAEIEASMEKARAIVEAVRASVAREAAETRVPAGAPARTAPGTEGMSAREKITLGIQQKGGTS